MTPERKVLDVDGVRVVCSVTGEGRPVLLINGLGANLSMWSSMTSALAGCRVIAFDAPGTGHSPPVRRPYSMNWAAQLSLGVLDRLGVETVDVVGYSLGGAVAQEIVHIAPDRVRRLVLAATGCGWGGVPGSPVALASIATPVRYYSRAGYTLTARFVGGGQAETKSDFIERTLPARLASPPSMIGYWLQLVSAWGWSSLPWLNTVRAPTLVLAGDSDPLVPGLNGVLLAGHIPTARLITISDWGHYILLDPASGAPRVAAEFLGAAEVDACMIWRRARRVSHCELARAESAATARSGPAGIVNAAARWWFLRRRAVADTR